MKLVSINNRNFEVITSNLHNVAPITGCNRNEIYEAYGVCSRTKIDIWHSWCDWCEELNKQPNIECGIQIESHNGYQFTISGSIRVTWNEGDLPKVYDIYITKAHNRLYKHN